MYNTPQDNIFSIKDSGIHKEKLVINMEVGFTMDITKEILRRATIQGIKRTWKQNSFRTDRFSKWNGKWGFQSLYCAWSTSGYENHAGTVERHE